MLDALIQGILLGGYYAILAAGLSLMFGVVRFINLAHGDLAIFGAYLVLFAVEVLGLSPWLAVVAVVPIMALLGWALQATLFARTIRGGFLLPLLTTFGLGAVLHSRLSLKDGRVQQSNYHDYQVLRLSEMPKVEVHIVPSTEKPGGIGETGVPPIAPAVANAVFALTGQRLRELPLQLATT